MVKLVVSGRTKSILMDKTRDKGGSMKRRYLGISLCILILFLSSIFGCARKRKGILEIPEGSVGIIAYGSLISLPSMEESLGHKYEGPIHEVHLTGYERVWTCVRPFDDPLATAAGARKVHAYVLRDTERVPIIGAIELNIYPKKKGRINGILYLITNEDLIRFDKREYGYRRVDVTDKIEEFRFLEGKVYIYEGLSGPPMASSVDKGTYILIKEFLDLVTGACDARGKGFRNEFDKSTRPCGFPVVSFKNIIWEEAP
jgi:hypothetical protein